MLDELYRDVVIQHYQRPAHRGPVPDAQARGFVANQLCGDEMTIEARIEDGTIAATGFEARGCAISQASADMMAEAVAGKTPGEALGIGDDFRRMMEDSIEQAPERLGELRLLANVRKFPVRIKCALLPWEALALALEGMRTED